MRGELVSMVVVSAFVALPAVAGANVVCTQDGHTWVTSNNWGPGGANFDPDRWVHCRFDRDANNIAVAPYQGANCSDGGAAGFSVLHFDKATAGNRRFLVYLQGGEGTQYQQELLTQRLVSGAAVYSPSSVDPTNGMFNENARDNPFKDYVKVFIRACTNDGWAGNGGGVRLYDAGGYRFGASTTLDIDATASTYTVHGVSENRCQGAASATVAGCVGLDHTACLLPGDCCATGTGGDDVCDADLDQNGVIDASPVTVVRSYPMSMPLVGRQSATRVFQFNGQRVIRATFNAMDTDVGVDANLTSNFAPNTNTTVVLSGSSTGGYGTLVNAFESRRLLGGALRGIYVDAYTVFGASREQATTLTDWALWRRPDSNGAFTSLINTSGDVNEGSARYQLFNTSCGAWPAAGQPPSGQTNAWCLIPNDVLVALDSTNGITSFLSFSAMDGTIRKCDKANGLDLQYDYCTDDAATLGLTDENHESATYGIDGRADCVSGEDPSYVPNYCQSIGYTPGGAGREAMQAANADGATRYRSPTLHPRVSYWIERETDGATTLGNGHQHMHATESRGFDGSTYFNVAAGGTYCDTSDETTLSGGQWSLGAALTRWVNGNTFSGGVKAYCPLVGTY